MYSFVYKNKPEKKRNGEKYSQTGITDKMLNDKDTTIFNLKYRKVFLIWCRGKEWKYYITINHSCRGIIKRQVDYFLFLLEALS